MPLSGTAATPSAQAHYVGSLCVLGASAWGVVGVLVATGVLSIASTVPAMLLGLACGGSSDHPGSCASLVRVNDGFPLLTWAGVGVVSVIPVAILLLVATYAKRKRPLART